MLEEAKKGELQGLVGVAIFDDGTTDDFWYEAPNRWNITVISDRIVGALHRCAHKLLTIRTTVELRHRDEDE